MLFTQFEFLFLFLPITLAGYFLLGRFIETPTARLSWLAAASLFFYGNWDLNFLPVILISIAFNFTMGALIDRHHGKVRDWLLSLAIAGNLVALGFYKYSNFGIQIINGVAHARYPYWDIVLPLGISFFTFTQIAYLVDVYQGYRHDNSILKYTLFVTYFPHLVAGPILHHKEMMPQFGSKQSRIISAEKIAVGLTILTIGLVKKTVIADNFGLIANPVFQAAHSKQIFFTDAWGGALAYSLQIYFDFSGYSDMAIGLSTMFGIKLPFNFDSPYKSRSITEFWRRWHISLSRFLRDYLYIPLGGNRLGESRRYSNLFVTMVLGGLWHGAGFTFLIWGALHGLFLAINHRWTTLTQQHHTLKKMTSALWYPLVALCITQLAVVLAWVFFRADNPKAAIRLLQGMSGLSRLDKIDPAPLLVADSFWLILGGYVVCLALPNVNRMFAQWKVGLETYKNPERWTLMSLSWRPSIIWAVSTSLGLVVALLMTLVAGDTSQFLYFQF